MRLSVLTSGTALDECAGLARRAEALGFEAVWVPDHLVAPHEFAPAYPYQPGGRPRFGPETPFADPWIMITHLAGVTTKVRLGVGVFILPMRNVFAAAKAISTTQVITGNRVMLGVGIGWMREEFEALGERFERRGPRTEEMLAVMRKLWTGAPVAHHGEFYEFDTLQMSPGIGTAPPLYWGGKSAPALRRAARLCDGWFGPPCQIDETLALRAQLEGELSASGRDPAQFDIWARAAEAMGADIIARYRDAGFKHLAIRPPDGMGGAARLEWLDQVAAWAVR